MKTTRKKQTNLATRPGSALIMTVVITVLLALVGVLFVMGARLDKMATASISENKELEAGVDAVVEKISQELIDDVPGASEEYYDYPGPDDPWLANLEPYQVGTDYKWQRISDIYGRFDANDLPAEIKPEYPETIGELGPADADGDGVADSRWIKLPDITTSKGKPLFAAVRIIDHGAMLNVNTAFSPDPNHLDISVGPADGSSQLQIELMSLSWRPGVEPYSNGDERALLELRDRTIETLPNITPAEFGAYAAGVIWRFDPVVWPYTPFDISDELELRYRFLLNHTDIDTRLEAWGGEFRKATFQTPVEAGDLDEWFISACAEDIIDPNYAYRHIATTYNFDRIIDPNGDKMLNVNTASANEIHGAMLDAGVDTAIAAQLAVNIIDFSDGDAAVTPYPAPDGKTYYGFEAQPFISEIGTLIPSVANPNTDSCYAVELYNPFDVDIPLDDFTLSVVDQTGTSIVDITFTAGDTIAADSYFVIASDLTCFGLAPGPNSIDNTNLKLSGNYVDNEPDGIYDTWDNYNLNLTRRINGSDVYVDRQKTDNDWFTPGLGEKYLQRDDDDWHIVYQTMEDKGSSGSLGAENTATNAKRNYNLKLAEEPFVTVGDIVLPLRIGHDQDPNSANSTIGEKLNAAGGDEAEVRLDLTNPAFRNIFRHLTVFDPADHGLGAETRVKGRININTAPWFVIAQLPWMTDTIAQAIVAYRDKLQVAPGVDYSAGRGVGMNPITPPAVREDSGFANIVELLNVTQDLDSPVASDPDYDIRRYGRDSTNNSTPPTPDLTADDTALDDFEERDLIFSRMSNLVTVRSDVFCAYILVRLDADGPQKRVMVILDRSDVSSSSDKVKIVAYHPVPDPR